MVNKRQVSLILRIGDNYLVQARDNVQDAKFRFPGVLSLFGGELEDGETGWKGFLREMSEEIEGIDFPRVRLERRVYDWKKDLTRVEAEINEKMLGNWESMRGFNYGNIVPQQALGPDRGRYVIYKDIFEALKGDEYYVGELHSAKIRVREGTHLLLQARACLLGIFYPTDKIALAHEITRRQC